MNSLLFATLAGRRLSPSSRQLLQSAAAEEEPKATTTVVDSVSRGHCFTAKKANVASPLMNKKQSCGKTSASPTTSLSSSRSLSSSFHQSPTTAIGNESPQQEGAEEQGAAHDNILLSHASTTHSSGCRSSSSIMNDSSSSIDDDHRQDNLVPTTTQHPFSFRQDLEEEEDVTDMTGQQHPTIHPDQKSAFKRTSTTSRHHHKNKKKNHNKHVRFTSVAVHYHSLVLAEATNHVSCPIALGWERKATQVLPLEAFEQVQRHEQQLVQHALRQQQHDPKSPTATANNNNMNKPNTRRRQELSRLRLTHAQRVFCLSRAGVPLQVIRERLQQRRKEHQERQRRQAEQYHVQQQFVIYQQLRRREREEPEQQGPALV